MSFVDEDIDLGIPASDFGLWDIEQCIECLHKFKNDIEQKPKLYAKVELNPEFVYSILRYEELRNPDWLEKTKDFLGRQKDTCFPVAGASDSFMFFYHPQLYSQKGQGIAITFSGRKTLYGPPSVSDSEHSDFIGSVIEQHADNKNKTNFIVVQYKLPDEKSSVSQLASSSGGGGGGGGRGRGGRGDSKIAFIFAQPASLSWTKLPTARSESAAKSSSNATGPVAARNNEETESEEDSSVFDATCKRSRNRTICDSQGIFGIDSMLQSSSLDDQSESPTNQLFDEDTEYVLTEWFEHKFGCRYSCKTTRLKTVYPSSSPMFEGTIRFPAGLKIQSEVKGGGRATPEQACCTAYRAMLLLRDADERPAAAVISPLFLSIEQILSRFISGRENESKASAYVNDSNGAATLSTQLHGRTSCPEVDAASAINSSATEHLVENNFIGKMKELAESKHGGVKSEYIEVSVSEGFCYKCRILNGNCKGDYKGDVCSKRKAAKQSAARRAYESLAVAAQRISHSDDSRGDASEPPQLPSQNSAPSPQPRSFAGHTQYLFDEDEEV